MKKVFLSLAIAAIFSLGFIACTPKATEEEVEATDTEMVEEQVQEEAPVEAEPQVEEQVAE